ALVAPSPLATPRRSAVGWDSGRLAMILAVLEARCGVRFSGQDVYLNVAGGMRISEPAADLAVAAALVSSRQNRPLPPDSVLFGEVSLSGALRPVAQADTRLREATKLGFVRALGPSGMKFSAESGIEVRSASDLTGFIDLCFGEITD
ncbi:MAG: magnesium chelatase domain-containing protein, partial [Paracoccaceae bacterium]